MLVYDTAAAAAVLPGCCFSFMWRLPAPAAKHTAYFTAPHLSGVCCAAATAAPHLLWQTVWESAAMQHGWVCNQWTQPCRVPWAGNWTRVSCSWEEPLRPARPGSPSYAELVCRRSCTHVRTASCASKRAPAVACLYIREERNCITSVCVLPLSLVVMQAAQPSRGHPSADTDHCWSLSCWAGGCPLRLQVHSMRARDL